MSVDRNRVMRNTTWFLGIFFKKGLMRVCMIEKKTSVLFTSIHKRVKSIVFAVSIKYSAMDQV